MMSRATAYRAAKKLEEKLRRANANARAIVLELSDGGCVALGFLLVGNNQDGYAGGLYLARNPHYAYWLPAGIWGNETPIIDLD